MREAAENISTIKPRLIFREGFLDTTPGIDIIGERDGGLVECFVDINLINTEDVAVSSVHVKGLADSIIDERKRNHSESGQLTPVLLGLIEDEDKLSIIDGFHRTAALITVGDPSVYATIRESSREDVVDLRILTARSHKAVQFARIVEWVTESWESTEWSKQISAAQAFSLYSQYSGSGRYLGVSAELPGIKSWVEHKCEQWQMPASSIRSILSVALVADPGLVQEARHQSDGRKLDHITPSHLGVIALGLPNKFDIQRLVAEKAKQHRLRIPQTRYLVGRLTETSTLSEAQVVLKHIDLGNLPKQLSKKPRGEIQEEPSPVEETVVVPELPPVKTLSLDSGGVLAAIDKAISETKTFVAKIHRGEVQATRNELILARNDLQRMAERLVKIAIDAQALARTTPPSNQTISETYGDKNVQTKSMATTSVTNEPQARVVDSQPTDLERPSYDPNNPYCDYLLGTGDFPTIDTIEQARFVEKILKHPPRGSNTVKIDDIREVANNVIREFQLKTNGVGPPTNPDI